MYNSKLYSTYQLMLKSCFNPSNKLYKLNGLLGVSICDDWLSYSNFESWSLSNGYIEGYYLTKIDKLKDYSSDNCVWLSRSEWWFQREDAVLITAFGETKNRDSWLKDSRCVISKQTLRDRINRGINPEIAMSNIRIEKISKIKIRNDAIKARKEEIENKKINAILQKEKDYITYSENMSLENEIWVPCINKDKNLYPYEVSNFGRVRRKQLLKPTYNLLTGETGGRGYHLVCLTLNGSQYKRFVHHLVLESFGFKRPEGYEVNHIDMDKLNNKLENLEWVTGEENRRKCSEIKGWKYKGEYIS